MLEGCGICLLPHTPQSRAWVSALYSSCTPAAEHAHFLAGGQSPILF